MYYGRSHDVCGVHCAMFAVELSVLCRACIRVSDSIAIAITVASVVHIYEWQKNKCNFLGRALYARLLEWSPSR